MRVVVDLVQIAVLAKPGSSRTFCETRAFLVGDLVDVVDDDPMRNAGERVELRRAHDEHHRRLCTPHVEAECEGERLVARRARIDFDGNPSLHRVWRAHHHDRYRTRQDGGRPRGR